ncbi:HAUS1 protein, partial [Thinocorus orbignyianus]|nr:HAUS1 protein [Thinocorus orbignyianus]
QVTASLKKVFEDDPIPEYEVNEQTVDYLYNLTECDEASERDTLLLIENINERAAEYQAQTKRLQTILRDRLGISPQSLSSEGMSYLDELVNCAMILETKDTSPLSFYCAINDMTSELYATELRNAKLQRMVEIMQGRLTEAVLLEQRLRKDLKEKEESLEVEELRVKAESGKMEFLKNKSKDLMIRIKAAQEQIEASGLDQSLTHESLVKLSE